MRFPISLIGMLVSTLFIWLLANIPLLNLYLIFVLLPAWPVITINGGMIAVAVEVLARKLSFAWLAVPLFYFGGYASLAWADQQNLASLRTQIAEANARVRVPFNPAQQQLVFEGFSEHSLIQNYGLPVAFEKRGEGAKEYQSTRMIEREVCEQIRGPAFRAAGIWPSGCHEPRDKIGGWIYVKNFCMVSMPDSPSLPIVKLSVKERRDTYSSLRVTYRDTKITTPDDQVYQIRGGHASALGWIPLPFIAYDPMSSPPRFKPTFAFKPSTFLPLNNEAGRYTSGTAALANALGLKKIAPEKRKSSPSEAIMAKIIASQRAIVADETAKLDRVLVDVQSEIGSLPFNSLRGRQDIILPRIAAIVAAVERGVAESQNGRNNAQQMFHLLEQAQPEAVTPYLNRIKALEAKDKWFRFESKPVTNEVI